MKLLEFQKRIGVIAKDSKNPHFKNTYASLTQILSEVKPIMSELGLTIMQPIKDNKVFTCIYDGATEIATSDIQLPVNLSPQQLGSAITYYRRYTLASLLALEIDDDDAQDTKPNVRASINVLLASNSLDELANSWKLIGAEMQKVTEVLKTKEEMKLKLTTNGKV
jgi:oligoendopeptidase F